MKPKFSTLILLTLISAAILAPFAFSSLYLASLRENSFQFHQFLQGEIYKQSTGYLAMVLVLMEMVLTARKRGRGWPIKVVIPGTMLLWRSLHIFVGVGLLAMVLVHTFGATGLNFNAVFLWIFFGVSLSALVGVVAETGFLESPRRYFTLPFLTKDSSSKPPSGLAKGPLIRGMRAIWLPTHIFLVSVFFIMLGFHIFLAYYYQ